MRVFRIAFPAALALVLVGLLVMTPRSSAVSKGKRPPDFRGTALDGREVSLSQFRGKNPVVLNFFAEFCPPCHTEFPHLCELDERYRAQGLRVIAVSLDDTRTAATSVPNESGARFPVLFEPEGRIAAQYGVQSLPYTVVIDRNGLVHTPLLGVDRAGLDAAVATVLR